MVYIDEGSARLDGQIKSFSADMRVSEANKKFAMDFTSFMQARGLNPKTIKKHLYSLAVYLRALGNTDALKAKKADIEKAMGQVEASKYSLHTKHHIKVSIKMSYKHFLGEDLYYPKQIAWIKASGNKGKKMLPEDILSEKEIRTLIEVATNARDKAIIAVLFDTGMRVGELCGIRFKDVDLASQPAHVLVNGKTGMRKIPLMFSVPYMVQYINICNNKKPADLIWRAQGSWSKTKRTINYQGIRKVLQEVAKNAGIEKRIYPHLFRHSRASYYANKLTEQQLKAFFGWTGDSTMASIYVHLSGRDIDNAVMQANGLEVPKEATKSELANKVCGRCHTGNTLEAVYCSRCAAPLDIKTAMNLQQAEETVNEAAIESMTDEQFEQAMSRELLMRQYKRMAKRGKVLNI